MAITLDGATRIFPIVGDPVAQVKSPGLLSDILARRGVNGAVIPAHVAPADFALCMDGMKRTQNIDGVIFTVPHKFAALEQCDAVSERARFAGSVNVMRKLPDGRWFGDNTDGMGFVRGVAAKGFDMTARRALLVGCGGAGSAIAYEILASGAASLAIHDADGERRDRVIGRLDERFPGRVTAGGSDPSGFDFVGNATPMGMRDTDPMPVEADRLAAGQFCGCVITKPAVPRWLAVAQSKGCGIMAGTGMFEAQADLLVDMLLGVNGAARPDDGGIAGVQGACGVAD